MPRHLHLDFETFSRVDLRDVGAYRYAFDPSTEILCAAMALDGEEPVIFHSGLDNADHCYRHFQAMADPETLIYCHNAGFEMAICQALLSREWCMLPPDLSRFRCTMSLARRAALPAKLETLMEALGSPVRKDTRGKALIRKFSMMQPAKKPTKAHPEGLPERRIRPEDDPAAFAEFCEYCAQDVRAEQEVAKRLAYFDSEPNNENYSLDAVINARGVPVNLVALRHAQKLIDEETEIVSAKFRKLVGINVTQGAEFLKWLAGEGYPLDNLQAETIEQFLDSWNDSQVIPPAVYALQLKQNVAYASVKKVSKMIECAGPNDNRIRGLLAHHLATTGRWGANLVQWQNMKRPAAGMAAETFKGSKVTWSEEVYRDICAGISREMLETCYGSVLEVISSCIRHFLHDSPTVCHECEGFGDCGACDGDGNSENDLLDADYSSIEARIVNWLAGQEDALVRFRAYDAAETKDQKHELDVYRIMASDIFGKAIRDINKFPDRFVGKECELGCGFGLGGDRFRVQCKKKGYDLPEGLEFKAVKAWRKKHNKVVTMWTDLDNAAKRAILHKGEVQKVGPHLSFACKDIEGMPFLLMRLPSGRKLAYPRPKIVPGKFEGTTAVAFYANLKGSKWRHTSVWGGVWAENATQAVAADIMANGAHNCENNGYQIVTLIHDQALAYHQPGQTPERFVELLTDLPEWARGLPIAAEGSVVPFYKKD